MKYYIIGYRIKKENLRLPIERYEEAGYDVAEQNGDFIIGEAMPKKDRFAEVLCCDQLRSRMRKIFPWQVFYNYGVYEYDI